MISHILLSLLLVLNIRISHSTLQDSQAGWIAICQGCTLSKYIIKKGVSYSSSSSTLKEVTKSIDTSISAGFKLFGIGTSVSVSASIGERVSEEVSSDYIEEKEETIEVTCDKDLYQFKFLAHEAGGGSVSLKSSWLICTTKQPQCVPGSCIKQSDGSYKMPPAKLITVYRYFNTINGDHLSSLSPAEQLALQQSYIKDGVTYKLFDHDQEISGTIPLYRLYAGSGDHMVSTSETEGSPSYNMEWILGYCYSNEQKDTIPLYRHATVIPKRNQLDHMTSTIKTEGSYNNEMILCYVKN